MSENIAYPSTSTDYVKPLLKATGSQRKRAPLSVINSYGFLKCSNPEKVLRKCEKQRNFKSSFGVQNFEIYADENEVVDDEVNVPFHDYLNKVSHELFAPAIQPLEILPEVSEEYRPDPERETPHATPAWCTPYKEDIYSYFRKVERNFRPHANYMDKQSDITLNMRSILVDWLVEVAEEYKLRTETFYLTISYVDRFLSRMSVLREKLQLVGTASMFLAAKFEEIYPPELKDFVYITDDTYTRKQITHMEHLILKALNFDISVPTAYSFLQIYCSMCNAPEIVMYLSQYICELSLLDADSFLLFLPSITAAGSLALANYTLGYNMWDEILVASSGYRLTELEKIVSCLYNMYVAINTCPQQAISEKYKAAKYKCVSTIQVPKQLVFPENTN